jgi:hypothetical protein
MEKTRIREGKKSDPGSGINILDVYATLVACRSDEGVCWGAEHRFELETALQQPEALPPKIRRTLN